MARSDFLLVASYFLTTWNVRSEEWATAMFLAFFFPKDLLPVSLNYLISTFAAILFGLGIGYVIDRVHRLAMVSILLIFQKAAIIGISLFLWRMNGYGFGAIQSSIEGMGFSFWMVVTLSVVLRMANLGTQIAIEKDWVITLSTSHEHLSQLNAKMKRVDLFCKLVSPIVISFLVEYTSIGITILVITGISSLSAVLELILVSRVYYLNSKLKIRAPAIPETAESTTVGETGQLIQLLKRPVFRTVIAVSLLYLNVLAFGPVMISYLIYRSFSAPLVSGMRAISVIIGLSSTFTFEYLEKRIGLIRLGLWSIWSELTCFAVALASFAVSDDLYSVIMLITGVSLSRWGLYSFDLVQTQLLQEDAPDVIGEFAGIQISLQYAFDLLQYGSTSIWSDPKDFWIPSAISFGSLSFACIMFASYGLRERGHLIHWERFPLLRSNQEIIEGDEVLLPPPNI